MHRIIYRYLLMEILPPFGVGLLGFTSIVFLGRMMRLTQMIVVKGVGLVEVLKSCAYLLPYLLVFTLPMAATVGILLALTRLTVDHEVIAMKTSGLSYLQLLPPILAFSLATMALTLMLTVFGSPWGQQATRDLLTEVMKRRADLGLKEQAFNTEFQGLMLFVNQVSAQGQMEGVFINDIRDEDNPQTIYAKKGQLSFDQTQETMIMNLLDGRVIRWELDPSRVQTVEFKTYQLPLQLFGMRGERSESEMSLAELWAVLSQAPPGTERHNRAMVELNKRFAMPLGALLLGLMAMPLGLSPRQHGRAYGLILGLIIFLVYYVVFTASWRLAINARINPRLAPWLPNVLFIWVAFYLWYRMVRELPLLPASWPSWSRLRPRTPRAWWGLAGVAGAIALLVVLFFKTPWRPHTPPRPGGAPGAVSGMAAKEGALPAEKAKKKARREKVPEVKAQAGPESAQAPAAVKPQAAAPPVELKPPPVAPPPAQPQAQAPPREARPLAAVSPPGVPAAGGGPPLTETPQGPGAVPEAAGPPGPPTLAQPLAVPARGKAQAPAPAVSPGAVASVTGGPPLVEDQEPAQLPQPAPVAPAPAAPAPVRAAVSPTPPKPPALTLPGEAQAPPREERYLVIAATYFAPEPARAFSQRLQDKNIKAQVVKKTLGGKARYQVQVGPLSSAREAEDLARRLQSEEKLPPPQVQKLPAATSGPAPLR